MHPNEHTNSYYAATANWRTNYPVLKGQHKADVCIVGAGFTGMRTALFLAERGYSVAVIEGRRVGWGASGRNGGQVIGGFCDTRKIEKRLGKAAADLNWQLGSECTAILRANVKKYQIECDLKSGYFDAAIRQSQLDHLLESMEDNAQRGYPYTQTQVGPDELRAIVNTDAYVGGVTDDGNGHVHALNLCLGEARAAASLGVKIFEQSMVTRITSGTQPGAHTCHGSVIADFLVLAGNAYLDDLVPTLRGAVLPAGSYIVATKPLGDLAETLIPSDMAICDQNEMVDYFRLTADKRLLFGGRCNYTGRVPRDISASIVPRMLRVFPQLENTGIDYAWGGSVAVSLNRLVQLGRVEPNIFYAMGYTGHGVAPTYISALILADAISGQAEKLDMYAKVKHVRLPGGKWFASPALALGMLYYRLKELR